MSIDYSYNWSPNTDVCISKVVSPSTYSKSGYFRGSKISRFKGTQVNKLLVNVTVD